MKKCVGDVRALKVRLNRIIGQLNGVQKMIDEDAPCEDIITQLSAVNGALHKIGLVILEGHIHHCVRDGIQKGDADETIGRFVEALESFAKLN